MAREYPTYIYTNETEAKSKGEFIVRTVKPRYIAKVVHHPNKTTPDLQILEWIDDWIKEKNFELGAVKKHAINWYLARKKGYEVSFKLPKPDYYKGNLPEGDGPLEAV